MICEQVFNSRPVASPTLRNELSDRKVDGPSTESPLEKIDGHPICDLRLWDCCRSYLTMFVGFGEKRLDLAGPKEVGKHSERFIQ
jgi:hypothetical protein